MIYRSLGKSVSRLKKNQSPRDVFGTLAAAEGWPENTE